MWSGFEYANLLVGVSQSLNRKLSGSNPGYGKIIKQIKKPHLKTGGGSTPEKSAENNLENWCNQTSVYY